MHDAPNSPREAYEHAPLDAHSNWLLGAGPHEKPECTRQIALFQDCLFNVGALSFCISNSEYQRPAA